MTLHYIDPHALVVLSKPLPSARFNDLVASVARDGILQPVTVHEATLEVVDGKFRVLAARSAGIDKVPVVFI